jgi:hypothetical protein
VLAVESAVWVSDRWRRLSCSCRRSIISLISYCDLGGALVPQGVCCDMPVSTEFMNELLEEGVDERYLQIRVQGLIGYVPGCVSNGLENF